MSGLYFLLPTLLVIMVSFLIVRAAGIFLMMTGMDEKRARFQALSAFSGTGFTTKEAESVVNHPVRRRIVTWLMILGNAGIVTLIVTATSSLVTSKGYGIALDVVLLLAGIYLIYRLATYRGLTRHWENFIRQRLIKSAAFEEGATEDLLHLLEGYGLVRATLKEKSPFLGKSLADCRLTEQGLLVLGVERAKHWIPIPKADQVFHQGDKLVVYGPIRTLRTAFVEQ